MRDRSPHLTHLGLCLSKPEMISSLEQRKEPWAVKRKSTSGKCPGEHWGRGGGRNPQLRALRRLGPPPDFGTAPPARENQRIAAWALYVSFSLPLLSICAPLPPHTTLVRFLDLVCL